MNVLRVAKVKSEAWCKYAGPFCDEWKNVNILEAECCMDHIHMLLEIPPKMSVSGFMGYRKVKAV
ncbi:hypothetical protein CIT292_07157 [Citrobacter youngae ATCC 29220]|uniref:Transposase IS200-like domain-containing protein n=1 Tax=Citrobacter youngae ATCC 29220 TaxID=500640 RepID=D4B9L7_9ENTR|nr:hypothetical protein CIT292_07157 [Citrobacter youngae ATCC 29220]